MSLTGVRSYFRGKLNTLGYREWTDGFNTENVPDTIINKSYHIRTPTIVQPSHNQLDLNLVETVEITLFLKGYRDPADAIDKAHVEVQRMLRSILDHASRTQGDLKDVTMNDIDIDGYSEGNDNMVRVTATFECLVIIDVRD